MQRTIFKVRHLLLVVAIVAVVLWGLIEGSGLKQRRELYLQVAAGMDSNARMERQRASYHRAVIAGTIPDFYRGWGPTDPEEHNGWLAAHRDMAERARKRSTRYDQQARRFFRAASQPWIVIPTESFPSSQLD